MRRCGVVPVVTMRAGMIAFLEDGIDALGIDGISDFNALHLRKHDEEVQLYAFEILVVGGEDLRPLPLSMRKTNGDG
jgi:bifunctional non-homologous end joining protein LigD